MHGPAKGLQFGRNLLETATMERHGKPSPDVLVQGNAPAQTRSQRRRDAPAGPVPVHQQDDRGAVHGQFIDDDLQSVTAVHDVVTTTDAKPLQGGDVPRSFHDDTGPFRSLP